MSLDIIPNVSRLRIYNPTKLVELVRLDLREAGMRALRDLPPDQRWQYGGYDTLDLDDDGFVESARYGVFPLKGAAHTAAGIAEIDRIFDRCDSDLRRLGRRFESDAPAGDALAWGTLAWSASCSDSYVTHAVVGAHGIAVSSDSDTRSISVDFDAIYREMAKMNGWYPELRRIDTEGDPTCG